MGFALDGQRLLLSYEDEQREFQAPCYSGHYLGSSDEHKVCADEASAVYWDVVHPTSYTHCWLSWFFERSLFKAGWTTKPPSLESHRSWCRSVSERTRGIRATDWILRRE